MRNNFSSIGLQENDGSGSFTPILDRSGPQLLPIVSTQPLGETTLRLVDRLDRYHLAHLSAHAIPNGDRVKPLLSAIPP